MSKITKCPLCGKKLTSRNGVPTCPDCGYHASDVSGASAVNLNETGTVSGNSNKNKNKMSAVIAVVIVLAAIISAGVVYAVGILKNHESNDNKNSGKNSNKQTESEKNMTGDNGAESSKKGSINDYTTAAAQEQNKGISQKGYRPESDMLIELVQLIFDKNLNDITREELDSIVYLDFYDLDAGGVAVYFELADGTSATCFMESTSLDTTDLKCFGGLEYLLLEDDSLDWGTDWHSLKNLYFLQCESSLGEIADVMDVSQLWGLILDSGFTYSNSMKDIAAYTNLQYLQLDAGYIDDISGLSDAPSLRCLYITDGDGLNDFEELYNLTSLEVLSIESSALRDIGFVKEMDNLQELELCNTSVKKIDALSECADTLISLRLHQNYQIEDYSVVFECTGLEELELYVDYDFDVPMEVPDLSMMTNLISLTIGNYDRFTNLKNIPQLVELTICDAYSGDSEALKGLTNLTTLTLHDMSITPEFIEPLKDCTSLTYLDMEGTFLWGDVSTVLDIPSLQSLYLTDADVGLKLDTLTVCDSLVLLDLEKTNFHSLKEDGSWDYGASQTRIGLSDNLDFFNAFPNLQVLYVPEHELDDLNFIQNMPYIYYLDISDNYVSDLSPLQALTDLEVLICPDNPIHDRTGMDNVILIE